MDTLRAFAMGEANRDKPLMVFDWNKAATLIKVGKPEIASAGLRGDWDWTGGKIFENGIPVTKSETYTFLASTWAVPELNMDGQIIECWKYTDEWDANTYWPTSARKILTSIDGEVVEN